MKIIKTKVTFYLENGQKVNLICDWFSTTKLSESKGNRALQYKGEVGVFSVYLDSVVAITSRKIIYLNLLR